MTNMNSDTKETTMFVNDQQLNHLRKTFSLIDVDGDGTIDVNELYNVLQKRRIDTTMTEVTKMIRAVDDNGDDKLDFYEFLALMNTTNKFSFENGEADENNDETSKSSQNDDESTVATTNELEEVFREIDADGNGCLDRMELFELMNRLGHPLTEEELNHLFEEADLNGDGVLCFDEFVAIMTE